MQYSTLALVLPMLAAAAPTTTPPTYGPGPSPSDPSDQYKKFALKVHVPAPANPDCHEVFEGGYLGPYHTGAGTNDVTVYFKTPETPEKEFFINGTDSALQADLNAGSNASTEYFPWTVRYPYDSNYAAFEPLTLNTGLGAVGGPTYFINDTGLQFTTATVNSTYDEFAGWLVCDWIHNVPQLFARVASYGGYPKNCEQVQLIPEYTS